MTKALVVGGGISGMATALVLSRLGIETELAERDTTIRALGSGITLIGPAMRALDRLGLLDACLEQGYGSHRFEVYNTAGVRIHDYPLPAAAGSSNHPYLPGIMGMTRPGLHQILINEAISTGVRVRTGTSMTAIEDQADATDITFSDGTHSTYDLVVGCDGLRSTVRRHLFPDVRVEFQGQACYRAVLPRHPSVTEETAFVGCPTANIGFTPTGPDSMYMYCCVPVSDTTRPAQDALPGQLRTHLGPFGGVAAWARERVHDPADVNYSLFETVLVPAPWHQARTVLVGDSAHSTTPQLAAGAAMCLEDALTLGEELASRPTVPEALAAYSQRRYDRCKFVVDTSVQLSYWQTHPDTPGADQEGLREKAFSLLAQPF